MPNPTRTQVLDSNRNLEPLAIMVSGKNPDGTDWSMSTTGVLSTKHGTKTQIVPAPQPSLTAQQILAANINRIEANIYNNGTQTVYLGKASTVTSTSFMIALAPNALYVDKSSNDAWFGITVSGVANIQGYEVS